MSMKKLNSPVIKRETNELIYETDIGTFAVKDKPGYNKFEYYIRKLDGTWPEDKHALGRMVNHYYADFGGLVTIGKDTAYVLAHGVD